MVTPLEVKAVLVDPEAADLEAEKPEPAVKPEKVEIPFLGGASLGESRCNFRIQTLCQVGASSRSKRSRV
jgi:hypothetical protein